MRSSRPPFRLLLTTLAVVWLAISAGPIVFVAFTSFKDQGELLTGTLWTLPTELSFENYVTVFENDFLVFLRNSIVVVTISTVLILIVSSMAAYVFSRFTFRLRSPLFAIVVAGLMVPIHVTLIPIFLLTRQMGLFDSIWALIGPYVAFSVPISVFILTGFMQAIPRELEESAKVDGAGPVRRFLRLVLPLSRPGLVTVAIFNFVQLWNEFAFAFVLTSSRLNRTLPLAIWDFTGDFGRDIPLILSVLLLATMPLIVAFVLAQERMIEGIMAGALKG